MPGGRRGTRNFPKSPISIRLRLRISIRQVSRHPRTFSSMLAVEMWHPHHPSWMGSPIVWWTLAWRQSKWTLWIARSSWRTSLSRRVEAPVTGGEPLCKSRHQVLCLVMKRPICRVNLHSHIDMANRNPRSTVLQGEERHQPRRQTIIYPRSSSRAI